MGKNTKKISIIEQRMIYEEDVYPVAQQERRKLVSDDCVIKDTFNLLEQLGIFLLRFPSDDELSGFHIKKSGINCIYINSSHTLGRQYFSAWHEYYHSITGDGGGPSFKSESKIDKVECKADLFAGYMLMPDNLIKGYLIEHKINLKYLSHIKVIKMQNYFGVSYSAMVKRLELLYPDFENIKKLYALGSIKRNHDLVEKTKMANGDLKLIISTNDIYIPQKFINDITQNFNNGRISAEKFNALKNLLRELNDD